MRTTSPNSDDPIALRRQAQNSLVRHVLGVSRFLQSEMMETLQVECGHSQLRLGFAPYITLIGEGNIRPTRLAEQLGITRQACNQVVRQLESAGYVSHVRDPHDGRAKLLALSTEGQRLRRDGIRIASRFDRKFARLCKEKSAIAAAGALRQISVAMTAANRGRIDAIEAQGIDGLAGLLPRVSDYVMHRIMALTRAKGHPKLKLSFGQVIPMIGPEGGRIQHIATAQDVSKQAISVIAMELEELGYISREQDPGDARQIVLRFTDFGTQFMGDAADSADELESELIGILGRRALKNLRGVLQTIFLGLNLEHGPVRQTDNIDVNLLATQLRQQLGPDGSRALGTLLLNNE